MHQPTRLFKAVQLLLFTAPLLLVMHPARADKPATETGKTEERTITWHPKKADLTKPDFLAVKCWLLDEKGKVDGEILLNYSIKGEGEDKQLGIKSVRSFAPKEIQWVAEFNLGSLVIYAFENSTFKLVGNIIEVGEDGVIRPPEEEIVVEAIKEELQMLKFSAEEIAATVEARKSPETQSAPAEEFSYRAVRIGDDIYLESFYQDFPPFGPFKSYEGLGERFVRYPEGRPKSFHSAQQIYKERGSERWFYSDNYIKMRGLPVDVSGLE